MVEAICQQCLKTLPTSLGETLFKRNYIRKERKNLVATPTGIELVQLIHEDLLKSAELTGIWEKKLREIERRTYEAKQFLEELKQMVQQVVYSVLSDNSNRRITIQEKETPAQKAAGIEKAAGEKKKRTRKATGEKKTTAKAKKEENQPVVPQTTNEAANPQSDEIVGKICPVCGKGLIIKGKTAYGCSEWKSGCTYRLPLNN